MAVTQESFGKSRDGRDLHLYTITNKNGMKAKVTNLGAILVELWVPDKSGKLQDIVLGYESADRYYKNPSFFGATVGPSANRIGNASYEIDGMNYELDVNDGPNNLHSHFELGYHKRVWDAETTDNSVTFSIYDPATLGFPGNKDVSVTYTVTDDNELKLHYHGTSDQPTILNLTNHTYFNLDGHDSGNILDHEIELKCANYTPTIPGSIPTGEIAPVAGTPMDLTTRKRVGDDIDKDFEQLKLAGGYDHNFCIDGYDGKLRQCATVWAAKSGRVMKVYTDLPGVQFYAGNFITPEDGKTGYHYEKRSGLCLETQYYPDTIHHDNFPSCIFGGEDEDARVYDTVTVYAFE
ncbi:MAG: galactose mutarotase [Lachnospiraceae bacterium]|nr:galactose mutarotase [Lachnospiraceae bacterium]